MHVGFLGKSFYKVVFSRFVVSSEAANFVPLPVFIFKNSYFPKFHKLGTGRKVKNPEQSVQLPVQLDLQTDTGKIFCLDYMQKLCR